MRCVAFICHKPTYIIMKSLDGFPVTQRQMTLKDAWVFNVRKLHLPRMSEAFLADTVDTIWQ